MVARLIVLIGFMQFMGCSPESLPSDFVVDDECIRVNEALIEPTKDDPHEGFKNVYLCHTDPGILLSDSLPVFPYPDGTKYIKTSTLEGRSFPWLIAIAEKADGTWHWNEYTRNFENEDYLKLPVDEFVCENCHKKAKSTDSIFTIYTGVSYP